MHIPAKKSLGQNFLKSKEAIRSIIEAGNVTSSDTVIEIGPGKGVLTTELLKYAGRVIAIEKDQRLIPYLQELFQAEIAAGKCEIREGDILTIDPDHFKKEGIKSYKLMANIPYYITGMIIRQFLTASFAPSQMVLLVQKEVADRIVARNKKESLLSMSVKAYGTAKYIQTVKAKYFSPAPKVDSAIISITRISKDFFAAFSEQQFFDFVRLAFAHKRKMLIGNVKASYPQIAVALEKTGLPPTVRAEDLSIELFKKLLENLASLESLEN